MPPPAIAFHPGALAAGTLIAGRYSVEHKLGEGGMAMVFRAMDLELGEPLALKIFLAHEDEALLARFKQELSLARKLSHANIVRLYDMGTHAGYKFITMELLDGEDMSKLLTGAPVETMAGIRQLLQACQALSVAHEAGVVHRDIKPENLFLTRSGMLKVMDFGIAKGQQAGAATGVEVVSGTPLYMSPEQIRSFATVTHLSDIYSLGVVAFEIFTGKPPFIDEDPMKVLRMHLSEPVPSPRELNPSLPDELDDLIMRMLDKDPSKRPQSCRDVASVLSELRPREPARR